MSIPIELTGAILDELTDKKALSTCRSVSKAFEDLTTPRVFQVLNLSRANGSHIAFMELAKVPNLTRYVKEINFRAEHNEIDGNEGVDTIDEAAATFSQLAVFINLETLCLYFPPEYENTVDEFDRNISPTRRLQTAIFEQLANLDAGKLRIWELEIHGLLAYPYPSMLLDGFRAFLRPIARLFITLASIDQRNLGYVDLAFMEFRWRYLPTILLASTCLESLTLISDVLVTAGPWDSITFHHLTSLRLGKFAFPPSERHSGLQAFIIRHAKSLVSLDLSTCCISIEGREPNPLSWANIWTTFEGRMEKLETFVFDPFPGRVRPRAVAGEHQEEAEQIPEYDAPKYEGYVTFLPESGLSPYLDEPPPDPEADKHAFESFQRVIAARRSEKNSDKNEP